jgi:AcrR family transcriptional regulator
VPKLQRQTLDAVRERIEEVALGLFVRQGYSGTTTRQIADGAGLTPGALYVHYPGKEALFAALVVKYRKELAGGGHAIRSVLQHTRFPDDIDELAVAIRDVVQEHRAYWLLWYVDVIEFEGTHFRSSLAPQSLLESAPLKKRLAELARGKRLRVEPGLAFVMVYMQLFNYFLVETIFGGKNHYGVPESRAVAAIADVFLHGMIAQPHAQPATSRTRNRSRK